MNLGGEFSQGKVCIKISNVNQIETLAKIIHEWLFEDVHVVYSKLYHGVYNKWLQDGHELSIGLIENLVQVLSDEVFEKHNYKQVGCDEFIVNVKEN